MEKKDVYLVLAIFFVFIFFLYGITGAFVGFGEPTDGRWNNLSWHYRFRIEINTTQYGVTDWPIERWTNFSELLLTGTFDINSIRVYEYSSSGALIREVKSQFDVDDDYNESYNAAGTLVFLMNGTTEASSRRIFYVYYDSIENGQKPATNYTTETIYYWDGRIVNVNNTALSFYIDTNRAENTSGLSHIQDIYETVVFDALDTNRTAEYLEYYNGTTTTTFDLIGNATIVNGSVRLTVKQTGDEVAFGNVSKKTNEGIIVKKYYIYERAGPQEKGTFIKIYQRFINNATHAIQRNSTSSGALALDLNRTLSSSAIDIYNVNATNPFSWAWASGGGGDTVGIVNLNESSASFYVNYSAIDWENRRIGIQLSNTTIQAGAYIEQTSLLYFGTGGAGARSEFMDIKNAYSDPPVVSVSLPERWYTVITPALNATIFNRNETVVIMANVSAGDPYNITMYINATIDMGTADAGDDQTLVLYDDGTHSDLNAGDKIFSNTLGILNNAALGVWTINYTAYGNISGFLNKTTTTFNVTETLNVTVSISNPAGLVNRVVLATVYVRNYRKDAWLSGATVNCTQNGNLVLNITDKNNGTYSINFTASAVEGTYTLVCNATKNGNFGNTSAQFTSEAATTFVNMSATPRAVNISRITMYANESFTVMINVTNIGFGTVYNANITPSVGLWSPNKTVDYCGNVSVNSSCALHFNVTVLKNTSPGNYSINFTAAWTNPDDSTSSNITYVNVTVLPNPVIDVQETNMSNEAGDGVNSTIGNFTISSIGNAELTNITFSCVSGTVCSNFNVTFEPANISNLSVGANYSVFVNVSIPLNYTPGLHNGTINVSSGNTSDIMIMYVTVPGRTNLSILFTPNNYTALNVTTRDNETFLVELNLTNLKNASARFVNITFMLPAGWSANPGAEQCDNLTRSQLCLKSFNITIPNGASYGNYSVNATVGWMNPDNSLGARNSTLNVSIASNPRINLSESFIAGTAGDGARTRVANFTVLSTGNDAARNVTFSCSSGVVCTDFNVTFSPANISSIAFGQNRTVGINVSVPARYQAGSYNGTINVSSGNRTLNFTLQITVPVNNSWSMTPTSCQRSETPDEGVACEVNITNTGNDAINFTISPEMENHTYVNVTNFTANRASNYTFYVRYNVTNVGQGVYNTTFTIDAIPSANPDYLLLNITMLPFIPPLITVSISPNLTEQNTSVQIYVNVTDRSSSGISWAKINVTRPNGTIDSDNLTLLNQSGNLSRWSIAYNNTWGDVSQRGVYNILVYSQDNIGNVGNLTSTFTNYIKLSVNTTTFSSSYYQGDTGSIYHIARGLNGSGVSGVNTTFTIRDPNNNVIYLENKLTNQDGWIYPVPQFMLSSDALVGNYTLRYNSSYHDDFANITAVSAGNYTFRVQSKTVTVAGLHAEVRTAVVWYPDNVMRFVIQVKNGEGRQIDPTAMNLTVYDPALNSYFFVSLSDMNRTDTGQYMYSHAMGSDTASGMYLAVLHITQDSAETMAMEVFRVARGGPYDVRLTLTRDEVTLASYLDFVLVIENKGEVSQDVNIEYWVSSMSGTRYYSASEAVYTAANSEQSFTRSAYMYPTQLLGTYVLNAKVTYDTVQPPIIVNKTFIIKAVMITVNLTGGAGGAGTTGQVVTHITEEIPQVRTQYGIMITKYNSNISFARGMAKIEHVVVQNTGRSTLNNVSMLLVGIPADWFEIKPANYKSLRSDNSSVFLLDFNIPKTAETGDYDATLTVTSDSASDQKLVHITVFESIDEMLRIEIENLKDDLQELIMDTKIAESDGKDTSAVWILINETRVQINEAEDNLRKLKTENALENIGNAKNLLEKARDLLSKLAVIKVESVFLLWDILEFAVPIGAGGTSLIYFLRRKKMLPAISRVIPVKKLIESIRGKLPAKEELLKDREKIKRMMEVLENERKEQIVSEQAYKEMSKTMKEKLSKIEKRLSRHKA